LAVRFDLKDPGRITRWSDFAFWSYVVGSPLFVHSLFITVLMQSDARDWIISLQIWLAMVPLVLAVSFVGLLLNRRALILSTLAYLGFIVFRLLTTVLAGDVVTVSLVTLLLIGFYVTALGSRWTLVRRFIMARLPSFPWLRYLPPFQ